jgi:hypothetical protein
LFDTLRPYGRIYQQIFSSKIYSKPISSFQIIGGALVLRGREHWFRALEMDYGTTRSDRPDPWYPCTFSNPADALTAGFVEFLATRPN